MRSVLITISLIAIHQASVLGGEISGTILGSSNQPVVGASVILCDHQTGIPVSATSFMPFTENMQEMKNLAVVVTNDKGWFAFDHVKEGHYRLWAQSWPEKANVTDIFEKNGTRIVLHGIVDKITVPSDLSNNITMKPLGDCSIKLNEEFPNDDALFLVSTQPLSTDPILGFISWQGPFMQNLLGGNRMQGGLTEISGLPESKHYLSIWANDNNGGIGADTIVTKSGKTIQVNYIPIVCSWSNGRHEPPKELEETFAEMKTIVQQEKNCLLPFLNKLLTEQGITIEMDKKARNPLSVYYPHLNQMVTLPSKRQVRFADVLASLRYIELQRQVQRRKQ